jgi:hypothetical protein
VRGLPQEKEQIGRALADYQTALGLYQSTAPYGNSSAQIVRVQQDLESVQTRLQELNAPAPAAAPEKAAGVLGRLLKALVGGSKAPPAASPGASH